jgi:ubiquinone/menaquinone biosynthesis C-methylase UbiE
MNDPKSMIAATYDRSAADFAALADYLVYRHLAAPLAARLRGLKGTVLDVAGGAGALARQLERAVVVDISLGQLLHGTVEAKVAGDAEALPFRDDAFAAAGSAFGINHFPRPEVAVAEMGRVAPVVGLVTWARPADAYAPKEIVLDTVARHAGRSRTDAGDLIEEMTEAMGSVAALRGVLKGAGLAAEEVEEIAVDVPWPGVAQFVDYRLAMTGVGHLVDDPDAVRAEAAAAIARLPAAALEWRPRLVVAIGRR